MPPSAQQNNLTIPLVLFILTCIAMTTGGMSSLSNLTSTIAVLASKVETMTTEVKQMRIEVTANSTRITKIETRAEEKEKKEPHADASVMIDKDDLGS